MQPSRETIYSALYDVLVTIPGLRGYARRWIPWSQIAPAQQPFLILREYGESYEWRIGGTGPATKTLIANVFIYQRIDKPNADGWGASDINQFLDTLEATLMPGVENGMAQTLGNLVRWCRVEGRQTIYEGDAQQQALTALEVRLLAMGPGPKLGG